VKVASVCALLMAGMTFGQPARACECLSGVWPWPPPGSSIPTNGIVILRGNERVYQDLVAHINERRPALACGKHLVPLRMKDLYVGYHEAKALLVPARALPPLTRCELVLTAPSRTGDPTVNWINGPDRMKGPATPPWWETRADADHRRPLWTAPPQWTGQPDRGAECGMPDGWASAKLSVPVADGEGPLLIHVFLDDGHEKNDFVIAPEEGQIDVGYDMCGGAFELEEGRKYHLRLSAMDAAGNEAPSPGKLSPITPP
jgi:hypothetical protein